MCCWSGYGSRQYDIFFFYFFFNVVFLGGFLGLFFLGGGGGEFLLGGLWVFICVFWGDCVFFVVFF